ncbi:hypothetical protein JWJ88_14725 [Paracoccus methylovorus]|uniref:GIY-YIG nuclease family protein n=1 Tax=Paracoccus methylovorus TaxID=2812658 RepID=A0ABX7JPI9_9RHOB|nr:hypothetical protein [Paracoccus methylovorus]QRZ15584.1 hypothetical protein JWJ88_14725 [Paracoccus methylovorus]
MTTSETDFWTDETSVLFTSFWGWTPETWGTVGWSGDRGKTRRANLLKGLTDPFITVCYVTSNKTYIDPKLKGMIAGFMLVTHETGDRDEFTHPIHHARDPDQWRHSLRAVRAFSYLPEYRLRAQDVFPELSRTARHVSAMGEVIADSAVINLLRQTPWIEVAAYSPAIMDVSNANEEVTAGGAVRPGPDNEGGYSVPPRFGKLARDLYVLKLEGNTNAYLGRSAEGRAIYKIGLSASPDMRRQLFQKSMPRGAFQWVTVRTSSGSGFSAFNCFADAVAAESIIKKQLVECAEWLGGEFYLANEDDIETAWHAAHASVHIGGGKV